MRPVVEVHRCSCDALTDIILIHNVSNNKSERYCPRCFTPLGIAITKIEALDPNLLVNKVCTFTTCEFGDTLLSDIINTQNHKRFTCKVDCHLPMIRSDNFVDAFLKYKEEGNNAC